MRSSYEERHLLGEEPESIDKEFIRLWFAQNCDPYNDKVQFPALHRHSMLFYRCYLKRPPTSLHPSLQDTCSYTNLSPERVLLPVRCNETRCR